MKILRIALFASLFISSLIGGGTVMMRLENFNEKYEEIKGVDANVISALQEIRFVQEKYFEVNNAYAEDWQTLNSFLDTGRVPIVQVSEEVLTVGGKDQITVKIDTLNVLSVHEVATESFKYYDGQFKNLGIVPVSRDTFKLYTAKRRGEYFIEVLDGSPVNPQRGEKGKLKPLRFGSKAVPSVKGNWE
jgi:hypothetical protein